MLRLKEMTPMILLLMMRMLIKLFLYSQSDSLCLVTFLDVHGSTEVEENHSNNTTACDDDAPTAVVCTHSHFFSLKITNFTIKLFFACF